MVYIASIGYSRSVTPKPPLNNDHRTGIELSFPCGLVCSTNSSPIETELMYNEIFEARQYMRSGIALSSGDTIVDVGANIGMFTMYAVEPVSETFEVLTRNMQRFGGRVV